MKKSKRLGSLVAAGMLAVLPWASTMASGVKLKQTSYPPTQLWIYNQSNKDVYTIIRLNGGNPSTMSSIQVNGVANWVTPPTPSSTPTCNPYEPYPKPQFLHRPRGHYLCEGLNTEGFFNLGKGQKVQVTSSSGVLDSVSITFEQPYGLGCPCGDGSSCSSFFQFVAGCPAANGINAAEVTLNVPTEETVDITCNGGANTTISVVGSKSSNLWQVGVNGAYTPLSIQNSWVNGATGVDNNCGGGTGNTGTPIPGVFPFQLSSCTTGPNTCSSATNNVSCSSPNDGEGPCQFTRAAGISGGKVTVSYLGSLQP